MQCICHSKNMSFSCPCVPFLLSLKPKAFQSETLSLSSHLCLWTTATGFVSLDLHLKLWLIRIMNWFWFPQMIILLAVLTRWEKVSDVQCGTNKILAISNWRCNPFISKATNETMTWPTSYFTNSFCFGW